MALLTMTSLMSRERTVELLAAAGLRGEVVAWELSPLPEAYAASRSHIEQIEELSDAYHVQLGEEELLVVYLLELRHVTAGDGAGLDQAPWDDGGA